MRRRLTFRPSDLHGGNPAKAHEIVQFSHWVKEKKLVRLKRGLYTLFPEDRATPVSALSLAEPLYRPSYISLAYALSHYGLIPEAVGAMTCVTTLKTARFSNLFGSFLYQHVHPRYFFGFVWRPGDEPHWMALPEKAVLDFIHLGIPASKPLTERLFLDNYRFQNFKSINGVRLKSFLRRFPRPRVQKGGRILLRLMENSRD
ncbi:MAG: hypothetical protein IPN19_06985 [Elusimicrobia bacterium]|nr:hypothetical protein [Elusimicrobiota bacterium]